MDLDSIRSRIAAHGLAFRGAFHPGATDQAPPGTGTIVLAGFTGTDQWPVFAASPEAADGLSDPLDRWSRRVVAEIAASVGANPLFPFGGPPFLPFQRWAQKAEPVRPSPLGILIHPDWGLWHAYRGALAIAKRLILPPPDTRPRPCDSCTDKPCLTACPVGAFTNPGYVVPVCVAHISAPAGRDCMDIGCRARLACPVGAEHRYGPDQARFHSTAFLAAQKGVSPSPR